MGSEWCLLSFSSLRGSGPAMAAAAFGSSDFQFLSEREGVHVEFVVKLAGAGIVAIQSSRCWSTRGPWCVNFLKTVFELDGEAGGWGETIESSCRSGGLGRGKAEG